MSTGRVNTIRQDELDLESFAPALRQAADSISIPMICASAQEAARRMVAISADEGRDRFLFAGSGDSLFAAQSAIRTFRLLTGLDARALSSMECSRYDLPDLASRAVVLAVSCTGNSSRTREAADLAEQLGVPTLAIVGSVEGPLAKGADLVLHRPVTLKGPPVEWGTQVFQGSADYLASIISIIALGLHTAVVRGTVTETEADIWRGKVRKSLSLVGAAAEAAEPAMRALAYQMSGIDTVWILGAGPARGSANYSAAKFHEQVPINGIAEDLEEWAHLQYFLTLKWGRRAVVMVLAPRGRTTDRAREIVQGISQAGGHAILITDDDVLAADNAAETTVLLPAIEDELFAPFIFHVPAQLLALHLARVRNVPSIPLARSDDRWLVRGGRRSTDLSY